jgi:hypothetical protein
VALKADDASVQSASPPAADETDVFAMFERLPMLLDADAALVERGRRLNVDCLLGTKDQPFHVSFAAGRIVNVTLGPLLMRSWCFSYRMSAATWIEFWKPVPRPGCHDLLALTKSGEAVLEGELFPFMTHLQYFKDVLALPRRVRAQ